MEGERLVLLDVLNQLEILIAQEDWAKAEKLDQDINKGIQDAVLSAKSDEEKNALIDLLKRIQSIYKLLITNTEESRSKTAIELKKISSDKKAANFYLKSSLYR